MSHSLEIKYIRGAELLKKTTLPKKPSIMQMIPIPDEPKDFKYFCDFKEQLIEMVKESFGDDNTTEHIFKGENIVFTSHHSKTKNKPLGLLMFESIDNTSCYLSNVCVKKKYRRCRIMTEMLSKIIPMIKKSNYTIIYIKVKKNNSSAIGFWEVIGFQKKGTASDDENIIVMYLSLEDKVEEDYNISDNPIIVETTGSEVIKESQTNAHCDKDNIVQDKDDEFDYDNFTDEIKKSRGFTPLTDYIPPIQTRTKEINKSSDDFPNIVYNKPQIKGEDNIILSNIKKLDEKIKILFDLIGGKNIKDNIKDNLNTNEFDEYDGEYELNKNINKLPNKINNPLNNKIHNPLNNNLNNPLNNTLNNPLNNTLNNKLNNTLNNTINNTLNNPINNNMVKYKNNIPDKLDNIIYNDDHINVDDIDSHNEIIYNKDYNRDNSRDKDNKNSNRDKERDINRDTNIDYKGDKDYNRDKDRDKDKDNRDNRDNSRDKYNRDNNRDKYNRDNTKNKDFIDTDEKIDYSQILYKLANQIN